MPGADSGGGWERTGGQELRAGRGLAGFPAVLGFGRVMASWAEQLGLGKRGVGARFRQQLPGPWGLARAQWERCGC